MTLPAYKNRRVFFRFRPCWGPVGGRTMTVFKLATCVLRLRHNACAHVRQVLHFELRKLLLFARWRERD